MGLECDTAASLMRILFRHVKQARLGLEARGLANEAIYRMLLGVVARLAYEEGGKAGLERLATMMGAEMKGWDLERQ
ncbi:MAG: hypothetical protein GC129_07245 [Proteobacteria bacterium]|nr:hypothetical protein [Pseudomonadota bacterium]